MEDNKKIMTVTDAIQTESEETDATSVIPADSTMFPNEVESNGSHHRHHSRHSHHHSHHHRHHHRRYRHRHKSGSPKRKSSKFAHFLKKHKSVLINILSCTVSVVLLFVLAANMNFKPPAKTQQTTADYTQSTVKIETSVYPEKIRLVSDAISYYLDDNTQESAVQVYKSFDGYQTDLNKGLPLAFTYRVTGVPTGISVESIQLEISENNEYSDLRSYDLDTEDSSIDIYNLKTGVKYYYRVNLTLSDGCMIGTTGSFETERSPRILNIDGAVNVRDIGGWNTIDGGEIKQGLLYRGSEIDGAVQPKYTITDRGLQQMIGDLGVRFDMDLRSSSENKAATDALGKNVTHKYYGVGMYSEILSNKEQLKDVFSDLADPSNYPIYLHCTYGRDRTGSLCYLLEALLGVSDSDLEKEYELSAFTDSYVNTAEFTTFVERIRAFEGDTTGQKVEGYLLSVGVTPEQIKNIKDIFLGE